MVFLQVVGDRIQIVVRCARMSNVYLFSGSSILDAPLSHGMTIDVLQNGLFA